MAMDEGIQQMIEQLKINNDFQTKLLKEKIADDKPSERIADQLPEIVADSEFLKKQIKSDIAIDEGGATNRFFNLISFTLSDQFKFSTRYYAESLNLMVKDADARTRMSTAMTKTMVDGQKTSLKVAELPKAFTRDMKERKKEQTGVLRGIKNFLQMDRREEILDRTKAIDMETKKNTARDKENKKDERNKDKNFLGKLGGFFTEPLSDLKDGFSDLTDGLLGKAGITTLIVLAITGLLAFFRPAAELFAAGLTAFASTFSGAASFLRDPTGDNFFNFLKDEFLGISMTLTLAFTVFRRIIKGISKFFLRLIAVPMLIFNMVEGIVDRVMRAFEQDYNVGGIIGAFFDGLIIGFFDGLKHVLNLLFDLLLPDDIAESFKNAVSSFLDGIISFFTEGNFIARFGNFLGELFKPTAEKPEGKAMGGPVAAGTPYIVGEKGPELFVPGAAGGIMPGLSGGNIIVNNNQVNQSASSATHQHSNVTIVDRQQEQVGL